MPFAAVIDPVSDPTLPSHDVVIMGGGLAGLTLALQLRQRFPNIDVLVLERKAHPVPLAAHKVGESSVEIGAHYFEHVLGLRDHLQGQQLRKFGFRFFFSEGRRDIENVTELGASRPLPVASYQLDRGIFENHLAQECRRRGVHFVDQAVVRRSNWQAKTARRTTPFIKSPGSRLAARCNSCKRAGPSTPAAAPRC